MWHFGIGTVELVVLALPALVAIFTRGIIRRWCAVACGILALSALASPADPLSMLLIAGPLALVFVAGVVVGPSLLPNSQSQSPESSRG